MADEAEKVINISLTKISESRTVRRGGTSLHKHLLINTVLTKARSAYFEAWYTGDGETVALIDPKTGRYVNLNSSFQDLEFTAEEEEEDDNELLEDPLADPPTAFEQASAFVEVNDSLSAGQTHEDGDEQDYSGSAPVSSVDPRFFVEVEETENENESEIELPTDILNCVEKLGDINDHMSFSVDSHRDRSASSASCAQSDMVVSNVVVETVVSTLCDDGSATQSTQLTYLDLDSSTCINKSETQCEPNNNKFSNFGVNGYDGASAVQTSPSHGKRRRGWSLEEDVEDMNDQNEDSSTQYCFSDELNEKLKRNGLSIVNIAKRLRFSPESECEDSGVGSSNSPNGEQNCQSKSTRSFPVIKDGEFRTKKSHFEEDEQDDDPFLGDAPEEVEFNDEQRVPSASSGSSSSEEDGESENCMEIDQITNLVQFISFNKGNKGSYKKSQSPMQLISSASSNISSGNGNGLVRSMSSPDLCGLASTRSSGGSANSSANNAKKDLFSYSNSGNSHNISQHRILTMTV